MIYFLATLDFKQRKSALHLLRIWLGKTLR